MESLPALHLATMHRGAYLVGVAGGSGSGKTTLVRALRDLLPPESVCIVSQDDYYLPIEQQVKDANGKVNFDLPGALDLDLLAEDLRCLASGEAVYRQEYNFNMATEPRWMEIRPARVILVEGLFLLQHPGLRELFDLKVFVEASEEIQLSRRTARDGTRAILNGRWACCGITLCTRPACPNSRPFRRERKFGRRPSYAEAATPRRGRRGRRGECQT